MYIGAVHATAKATRAPHFTLVQNTNAGTSIWELNGQSFSFPSGVKPAERAYIAQTGSSLSECLFKLLDLPD